MTRITKENIAHSDLFPVDDVSYEKVVTQFESFTDEELRLLDAANRALLPADSATRYVLDLCMRPALSDDAGELAADRQRAYRVGALIGRRSVLSCVEVDGEYVPISASEKLLVELLLDGFGTTKGRFAGMTVQDEQQQVMLPYEESKKGMLGRAHGISDPAFGIAPYLSDASLILNSRLAYDWFPRHVLLPPNTSDNLGLAAEQAYEVHTGVYHNLFAGMKDLFRLFALLEMSEDKNWYVKEDCKS
jgi:hypothetical protein